MVSQILRTLAVGAIAFVIALVVGGLASYYLHLLLHHVTPMC